MDEKTSQELALELLPKLIHLAIERLAMKSVLDASLDLSGQLWDWHPAFEKAYRDIVQENTLAQFSDIESAMSQSTFECPQAFRLLIGLVERVQKA